MIYNKYDIKDLILILLISFHIFFWDIKLFNNFGLREIIVLGSIFFFSEIIKKNATFDLNRKKLYLKILIILSLISFHLGINTLMDGVKFDSTSILGLFGIIFLFLFIENYYNFIRNNLDKFIVVFLIVLIFSILISGIQITTKWEKENLGHCVFLFKFSNIIFKENSHLAMMLPGAIGYLFLSTNKIIYKYFYSILFCLFFILQNSMTLTAGAFILIFLIFIYEKKKLKYLIPSIVIFILLIGVKNYIETAQGSCLSKLNATVKAIVDVSIKQNTPSYEKETDLEKDLTFTEDSTENIISSDDKRKFFLKNKVVNTLPIQQYKFYSSDGNEIIRNEKNIFIDYVPKNKSGAFHDLPRIIYKDLFNLSTGVLINSINISIETLKERIFGWGLNRYERAFDYYMFNAIIFPPFYHEIFTLNYNDGSSNLTKSITEFGVIAFVFIPIIFFFFFTDKVNRNEKVFFLTIILTQLLRGAGYFNGGFAFSLIFIILTYLKRNENKKKNS